MARLEVPTLEMRDGRLRPWRRDDVPALRAACGDEDICRFTTVPHVFSEEAALLWIERQEARAGAGTAIVLAIVPAGEREPVGMMGLFGLDQPEPIARLGYWLIARARGQGLATGAARALGRWAFAHLAIETLVIDCEPANVASARVAERLGAAFSGSRIVRARAGEVTLDRYTATTAPR